MTATHATGVTNLGPRIDHRANVILARTALGAAITRIHDDEHAGVWLTTCANPICVQYMALCRELVR